MRARARSDVPRTLRRIQVFRGQTLVLDAELPALRPREAAAATLAIAFELPVLRDDDSLRVRVHVDYATQRLHGYQVRVAGLCAPAPAVAPGQALVSLEVTLPRRAGRVPAARHGDKSRTRLCTTPAQQGRGLRLGQRPRGVSGTARPGGCR